MTTPSTTNLLYQTVSYDIFCPNATIAESLYSDYIRCPEGSFWKDVETSGNRFSCTSRCKRLYDVADRGEKMYKRTLENLSTLFQCDLSPEDYPALHVRVHVRYLYPGLAQYIYDTIKSSDHNPKSSCISNEDMFDMTIEYSDTIGVSCKNWLVVNSIDELFIRPQNEFIDKILAEERTQAIIKEYNNRNTLEYSTHSLITSICVMIMFIGLISKCCA